jgi:hypothetical protein
MAELVPHRLVVEVARELGESISALKEKADEYAEADSRAYEAAREAKEAVASREGADEKAKTFEEAKDRRFAAAQALAQALANEPRLPDLVTFAGFLGGTINHKWDEQDETWRLLYLDPRLQTWLLVREKDIVFSHGMYDETAPFRERDVIWVRSRASVNQGSGPLSAEARFLTGEFTRAADVEAPPSGATFAPATGVFCETRDPFGCHRKSQ